MSSLALPSPCGHCCVFIVIFDFNEIKCSVLFEHNMRNLANKQASTLVFYTSITCRFDLSRNIMLMHLTQLNCTIPSFCLILSVCLLILLVFLTYHNLKRALP